VAPVLNVWHPAGRIFMHAARMLWSDLAPNHVSKPRFCQIETGLCRMLNLTSDIPLYALGGIRQERRWDPRAPTLKTDGSKRPEPLEVDLGPTGIVKEWTRSLRRVLATVSLRSLIHDDLPAGELRGRPKKLAEILHHPLCGLPVALFSALLVLKDAH
jgi:hypothetical protein